MKIVIYDTRSFKEIKSKELLTYEDFKEILDEILTGKYKSPFYEAYAINEQKKIDCKLNSLALSRAADEENEYKFYSRLKKIGTNGGIIKLNKDYTK